ncbi:hypothetical protein AWJ20_4843 [Sugiyamaella lignohabitans]|uniref:Methyltransferase domain-containing protein n=1 Tax=Sugiyamaella lignohabitans TaxID=796027 RepID=A0A167EC40_9ASCO|nr:uncharacterized protein AWJ20_4843 [Sugiyamaella lignohabitans]ANB13892.1 hypothetical protein AWJ20_4843 [Sugiyamaella lignohabitans]
MSKETAEYTHGHHESVLRSHTWRTVDNSVKFLVPYLKPDSYVLDVGCGPGTITVDMAKNYTPKGKIIGMEYAGSVLEQAAAHAKENNVTNIEFAVGDVHNLSYPDNTFDIVFAHQVVQHIGNPVVALKEMARVVKPGGVVAIRDSDYAGFFWYPELPALKKWQEVYLKVAKANGAEPNAGRHYHSWAHQAGLDQPKLKLSSSTWFYWTPEERAWWSSLWADRTLKSNFATTVLKHDLGTQDDLEEIAQGWRDWGKDKDAIFNLAHVELIYQK